MWDKLRIRDRDRTLAVLFLGMLAAVLGFSLLALGFPNAAEAVGGSFVGTCWLFTVRYLIRLRRNRPGAAPVGPLSHDEKRKARSKLLKASRRTPEGQTRLYVNVGAEMGVAEGDIVGTVLGETGLPRKIVGAVDIRERHLFVDVASEYANSIISKLNRAQIKGHRAKVKVA